MELAELLEREAIADGDQLLDWARSRTAVLLAELDTEDSLRSLLDPGRELELEHEEVPIARRRRREPSSPQPKSADELPPLPDHPGLADGEPEPMLETVDTGPIDLEDEIVRRRLREDSWTLSARDVETFVSERDPARASVVEIAVEAVSEEANEPSIELEIEVDVGIEPAIQADAADAPVERWVETSHPELPVIVGPAASPDDPIDEPAVAIDIVPLELNLAATDEQQDDQAEHDEEFEVDELDELEVDELVELDEEIDDEEDDEQASAPKPPRPPPPKSAPPPIRNEVADMIASLSDPVRSGSTAVTRIDEIEGAPAQAEPSPASEDIDIDID